MKKNKTTNIKKNKKLLKWTAIGIGATTPIVVGSIITAKILIWDKNDNKDDKYLIKFLDGKIITLDIKGKKGIPSNQKENNFQKDFLDKYKDQINKQIGIILANKNDINIKNVQEEFWVSIDDLNDNSFKENIQIPKSELTNKEQNNYKYNQIDFFKDKKVITIIFKLKGYKAPKVSLNNPEEVGIDEFEDKTLPSDFKLSDTVTEIKTNAFNGATVPNGFVIPDNVKIASNAFVNAVDQNGNPYKPLDKNGNPYKKPTVLDKTLDNDGDTKDLKVTKGNGASSDDKEAWGLEATKVNGASSDDKEALTVAQAKIDDALTDVTAPTMRQNVAFGAMPTASDVTAPTKVDLNFTFKSATAVNANGKSTVTYTVNVEPPVEGTTPKDVTFEVDGFQTAVAVAQAKIDDALTDVTAPTMRQNVAFGAMPTASDVTAPTKVDLNFTFKSATAVNANGKSTVTYTVNVEPPVEGTTPKDVTFEVDGFQTAVAVAQAKIDDALTDVTAPTMRQNVAFGAMPTAEDVTTPTKVDLNFTFKSATAVNANGKSTVTYTVNVEPPVEGATPKDVTFEVDGFQTAVAVAQAKIDDALTDVTAPTMRQNVAFGAMPTAEDVTAPTKVDLNFTFKSATAVNANGKSTVTYTVNVEPPVEGTTPKDVTFEVDGFQTAVAVAQAKIDDALTDVTAPTMRQNVAFGAMPTAEDVTAPTKVDLNFTFKSATAVNANGKSTVTYTVNVAPPVEGATPKDVTFEVDGFQTAVAVAQAKIDDALTDVTAPTMRQNVAFGAMPTAEDVTAPTKVDLNFTFKSATAVNANGKSTVTYTVNVEPPVEGATPKDVTFEVDGFQTAVAVAQAKIDDALTDVTAPTMRQNVAFGAMPTAEDVTAPTKVDLNFTFKSATAVNANGKSTVTYTVNVEPPVEGTTPKDVTFEVDGFQTAVAVAQAKIDDALTDVTAPTMRQNVAFGAMPTAEDVTAPTKVDLNFTFKSATAVNANGKSTVTYTVNVAPPVEGATPKDVTFEVDGFQTAVAVAQAKIDDALTDVTAPTMRQNVAFGAMPTAEDVTAPTKVDLNFTFKSATAVNANGKSTVTYTVNVAPPVEGTTPKDVTFEVDGFQTAVAVAQAKIDDALTDVTAPTMRQNVAFGAMPTASDVTAPTKVDLNFTFKSATAVDANGKSTVTYTVNVAPPVEGATPKDVTFEVDGFQTAVAVAQAKIDDALTDVTAPTMRQNVAFGAMPTAEDVTAPTKVDLNFTFKSATAVDANGKATVTYTVDVAPPVEGTTPKDVTFEVGGFETQAEAEQKAKAKIDKANAKIQKVTSKTVKRPTTKKTNGFFTGTPTAEDFNAPTQTGFRFKFKEATAVDANGKATVTYTVDVAPPVEGTTSKDVTFEVDGFQTIIKENAFRDETLPEGFTIPDSITTIEKNAFLRATLPEGFTIPDGVTKIKEFAFQGATLPEGFTIPDGVTTIGKYAFSQINKLPTGFALPTQLATLPKYLFWQTNLNNDFKLSENVTTIGDGAFKEITLPEGFTIPDGVTTIGKDTFMRTTLPEGFTIPDGVTTIGEYAFQRAKLPEGFTIPDGVTTIGEYAFSHIIKNKLPAGFALPTQLATLPKYLFWQTNLNDDFKLSENVTTIGEGAFKEAILPEGFTIPDGVTTIGKYAFAQINKLQLPTGFALPTQLTTLPKYLFWQTNLNDDFKLSENVTTISKSAFKEATLPEGFTIPDGVTTIGEYAFQRAKLPEGFTIPDGVTTIGKYAFSHIIKNKLPAGFALPTQLATLPKYLFWQTNLNDDFKLSENVTTIGEGAFKEAILPEGFTIPDGVTTIGEYAFAQINKLPTGFALPTQLAEVANGLFLQTTLNDDFRLSNSITKIGWSAFNRTTLPKGFIIPDGVTTIGEYAFLGTTLPEGFTIPDGVTTIKEYAFKEAILPEGFTIPDGVTTIKEYAFKEAILPEGFTIPDGVTTIGKDSFKEAKLPKGFTIPEDVTIIK